ncbi:MAG: hypothetical protein ACE5HX_16415, partial [bacterium]
MSIYVQMGNRVYQFTRSGELADVRIDRKKQFKKCLMMGCLEYADRNSKFCSMECCRRYRNHCADSEVFNLRKNERRL